MIKLGIGGAFFHALGGSVAITLMAPLSTQLKTKAPGARTFLQVIYSRFGVVPHIMYCLVALCASFFLLLIMNARKLSMATVIN